MVEYTLESIQDVPSSLDWGNVNGVNYLTTVRNQHLPRYCGSCWAHGVTSMLGDRLNIKKGGIGAEWTVSPQMLVACSLNKAGEPGDLAGCDGGTPAVAMKWLENKENYLLDDSCMPYTATNGTCASDSICYDYSEKMEVKIQANMSRMRKYGFVEGSTKMVTERYDPLNPPNNAGEIIKKNNINMIAELQNGPIVCSISAVDEIDNWRGDKIYNVFKKSEINHTINVVGYGERDGVKFWKVRNSWGEYWGDNGFFYVERGRNILQIELSCLGAQADVIMPESDTLEKTQKIERKLNNRLLKRSELVKKEVISQKKSYLIDHLKEVNRQLTHSKLVRGFTKVLQDKIDPRRYRDHSDVDASSLPKSVDYTQYSATPGAKPQNILSWVLNQHRPVYCGSCYIQGVIGMLADRFNLEYTKMGAPGPKNRRTFSAQPILNCGVGSCNEGGSPTAVLSFIQKNGIPEMGCQIYTSTSPSFYERTCSPIQRCATCHENKKGESECEAITDYKVMRIKEWGIVSGPHDMKAEIAKNGPIQCSLMVSEGFWEYTGGIYSEYVWNVQIDHSIAIVGYGYDEESKTEYWVGRNSWGTMWGEGGYFRLKMYEDNLGVETFCGWATPDLDYKPDSTFSFE